MAEARYTLESPLSPTTWLARDQHIDRPVCIVLDWTRAEGTSLKRLCEGLQNVRSRNVIDIYDICDANGRLGLVCEHPPNSGIVASVADQKSKLQTGFARANSICDLHRQQISHGSISDTCWSRDEENIMNLHGFSGSSRVGDATQQQQDLADVKGLLLSIHWMPSIIGLKKRITEAGSAQTLMDVMASELLRDQHRALVMLAGSATVLDRTNRSIALTHPLGIATLTITYTGTHFVAEQVSGEVLVNNRPMEAQQMLPGACVIALGLAHRSFRERYSISWEQSSPEIVQ